MPKESVWEITKKKYKRGDIVELNGVIGVVSLTYLKWNTHAKHIFCDYYGGANLYNEKTNEWAKIIE